MSRKVSDELAEWLRANQNKRGTPDYQTVLRGFQDAVSKESREAFVAAAPASQPQSGFMPALRSGIEGLKGAGAALAGRTGLMGMAEAEQAIEARRRRQEEIFKPTEEWGPTKLLELLGGSLPYMAAPVAAAGAAAALPLTGTAAALTGLGLATAASATQFTGTNLSRQIEEGKKLAETDLGNAALAAVPMAFLDTLALRMLPGVGKLLGDAGIKVTKETAKDVSEQILKKAAIDYTAATGRAMTAEGLTEAAQQGFERLQAGLRLTDADARKEYLDSLIGGALLGGTIAPVGRMMERGKAKREIAAIEQEEATTQAAAAREAEQKRRADPDYLEGLNTAYQDLLTQKSALEAQIKKGSKEAPLSQEDKDANEVIDKQLAELRQPLKQAKQAFIDAGGPQALAKMRAGRLELTPPPGRVSEPLAAEPEEAPETPEAQRARLTRDMKGLGDLLKQHRADLKAAKTPEEAAEAAAQVQKTNSAFMAAARQFDALPKPPDIAKLQAREAELVQSLADAQKKGKYATVLQIVPELQQVRAQMREAQPFDLASEEYAAEEDRKRAELGELMGVGREAAAAERTQGETEQQVAREQAARSAALKEQLDAEGVAEREVMQELAADRAANMRIQALGVLKTAPQLGLFPEARQQVTRQSVEQTTSERPAEVGPLRAELARLLREKRALQRQAAQARPAPGAELAGPASLFVSNARDRIRALDTRIAEIEERLTGLTAPGAETRTVSVLPDAPQPDLRPQGPLAERLNTLAERALASPRTDEDTKALVREVQDNLPSLLRQDPVAQRTLGRRGQMQAAQQAGESVGAWLYRTLLGTAPPDLTQAIRDRLRALEAGRRSETERLPTGETRRAVQTEIEMPEPTAKAFESFDEFIDYLASEGLQAYRLQKGLVFPTLANLQKRLEPIQTRIAVLQKQLDDVNAKREALQKADEAERSSASKLLRESQQRLQAEVQELDAAARITYVGPKYKQVDLVGLLDQAHGRLNAALAHSNNLRQQFAQALKNITFAEAAVQPVTVDASGSRTSKKSRDVRSVAQGQLPAYQALRNVQLELQKKGLALVEADQKLEQVVKAGIGQSWDADSPTLRAYIRAKKAKDEAQRAAQQAHYALLQAHRRVPSKKTLNKNLSKFLSEKAGLDAEMAKAAKSLSAIRLGVRNAANRLNSSYIKMENNPELKFGDNLLRLRQDLLAAQSISEETMGRSVERQAQAEQLAREASTVAQPMRTLKRQVETTLGEARKRAKARQPAAPAKETQAEREARNAEKRREEQARLEREEAASGTRIEFEPKTEPDITQDSNYRVLLERVELAKTREERVAALKAAEEYFNARADKLTKDIKDAVRVSAGHLEALQKAKDRLKNLQERLEKNVTEKGRKMTPNQRAKVERDIEKEKGVIETHQKNYTSSVSEVRVKRTNIQTERAAKRQLLEDARSRFEPGQRLGEVEGTTPARAIGPVTRPEVYPPKTMRTGSEESRAGVTTTDARSRLTEARGAKQRDIAMTAKEMQAAQAEAAKMKTLEGLEKAEKALAAARNAAHARGMRPGEFERFEAREEILKARRAALTREMAAAKPAEVAAEAPEAPEVEEAPKKRGRKAAAVEEMEELDAFEPEFFSRGETTDPSTTASVRAELGKVFPDTGRVQIYDSVDALIAANPQYKGLIPSDARGFVDSAGNKAFLIAENIDKGQALSVLLHEVGAHIGLKNALGEAQYNALVNAVKAWEKKADGSVESRVAKAARERVEAAETKASQVDDELLAYAVEEAVNAGVKPTETKGVLGQWLRRVAALFRRALEKFGLPPKSLDTQGIVDMAFGAAKLEMRGGGTPPRGGGKPPGGELLFSRNLPTAARVANQLVAEQPTWLDKLKANFLGTGFRTQFIDKLDPVEKALKQGKVEELKAAQALFYLRMYDQRMHYTSQAVYEGAPAIVEKTRRDGRTERMIEAQPGANLKQVADIMLKPAVVKAAGSADAANKLFTLYLAAIRGTRVGFDKLNFGHAWATAEIARIESQLESSTLSPEMRSNLQKKRASLEKRLASMPTEADIKAAKAEIDADPVLSGAFQEARDVYNAYNRNLMQFAIDTGAIGQERGAKLLASNDYIPYYRMRDGVAELMIGSESPIRIGNLKDSPHLQELVGGDEAIFDFMTSSVQNTSLLIDMSMRNLATKNLMFELRDVGLAKISKVKGGNAPTGSVTFQKDGDEYFAVVDTDALGIDSELLVKGLAGIPTMFPTFVRLFGIPARLLRRLVVISPVYMARQLVRDTTAAAIASGANITPVVSALRQIGKDSVLERRGITGGMVFTGMPEDQARLLKDMQTGKLSIASGMARMEALSAKVDALAREAQYESYREQGLSEMEATLMALESMNFSRRGLSPTMHMVSTLIPFFNAQVQGLDVLYRSFRGDMPFNERLQVRNKLITRGMFLFGMSMLYATLMQDDEAYKNAKIEEKYGNFFVPVPGTEQMLRVPIPFELGYIFKALPEALVNTLANEEGGTEALKALQHIAKQTVPGLSSYFMPQAIKPALEVALDQSIFTGRDIESAKEKMVEPGYRYRESTTELAKDVGEATGFSPIKLEYLIRGYTGSLGMAALAALSAPFGSSGPEKATRRLTDLPVVGTLFQPTDASGIIDMAYEKLNEIRQLQETYNELLTQGRTADADKYLADNADKLALASVAGSFRQYMGKITQYERVIRVSSMTPDEKRKALDDMRQAKIAIATAVREQVGRT